MPAAINTTTDMIHLFAEYIWHDGNSELRSKTKVIEYAYSTSLNTMGQTERRKKIYNNLKLDDFDVWNFDGSSTNQASTDKSDLMIKPVKLYPDPFRGYPHCFVLCEVYNSDMSPHTSNMRSKCVATCAQDTVTALEPWFGIEQEYVLMNRNHVPLGWRDHNEPGASAKYGEQGPYYCAVGGDRIFGRNIVEEHMSLCLQAGLKLCGINAEVMGSQWEYQIGPLEPVECSDQMWISRYILHRVTEKYDCYATFHPKPQLSRFASYNGSGGHTNISTNLMRGEDGMKHILEAIEKLSTKHKEYIKCTGKDNDKRLSGHCETSDIRRFTFGNTNRGSSIRIPVHVAQAQRGYFEDRRPAANMDPYQVTEAIVRTICA